MVLHDSVSKFYFSALNSIFYFYLKCQEFMHYFKPDLNCLNLDFQLFNIGGTVSIHFQRLNVTANVFVWLFSCFLFFRDAQGGSCKLWSFSTCSYVTFESVLKVRCSFCFILKFQMVRACLYFSFLFLLLFFFNAVPRPSSIVTGTLASQSERTIWNHGVRLSVAMCPAATMHIFCAYFGNWRNR